MIIMDNKCKNTIKKCIITVVFIGFVLFFLCYYSRPSKARFFNKENYVFGDICRLFRYYPLLDNSKEEQALDMEENLNQEARDVNSDIIYEKFVPLPDDIIDQNGNSLLSWRVALILELQSHEFKELNNFTFLIEELTKVGVYPDADTREFHYSDAVDLNSSWNSDSNAILIDNCPALYNFDLLPYFRFMGRRKREIGTTTIFRVRETHQLIKDNKLVKGRDDDLPYLLFLDASSREYWTKPGDVSLEDLFDGKIKLRNFSGLFDYSYVNANFKEVGFNHKDIESQQDEWKTILEEAK